MKIMALRAPISPTMAVHQAVAASHQLTLKCQDV